MKEKIRKLIDSMDVKQDRENSESTALEVLELGAEAIDCLVDLGDVVNKNLMDAVKRKKVIRAIIYTLMIISKKKDSASFNKELGLKTKHLLSQLSLQGYESAKNLLYHLGFSESDLLKEQLLSLPTIEKHVHDKEISLNEALEEIKTGQFFSGFKGLQDDSYMIGIERKRSHKIYKIGKNLFAVRSSKIS